MLSTIVSGLSVNSGNNELCRSACNSAISQSGTHADAALRLSFAPRNARSGLPHLARPHPILVSSQCINLSVVCCEAIRLHPCRTDQLLNELLGLGQGDSLVHAPTMGRCWLRTVNEPTPDHCTVSNTCRSFTIADHVGLEGRVSQVLIVFKHLHAGLAPHDSDCCVSPVLEGTALYNRLYEWRGTPRTALQTCLGLG